jgi:hypothetical protein
MSFLRIEIFCRTLSGVSKTPVLAELALFLLELDNGEDEKLGDTTANSALVRSLLTSASLKEVDAALVFLELMLCSVKLFE